jgi:hypothetical protein
MRALSWLPLAVLMIACSSKKEAPASGDHAAASGAETATKAKPKAKPVPAQPLAPLATDTGAATGAPTWGAAFGGLGVDSPYGVAVGTDGAAYVTGYFEGESRYGALGAKKSAGGSDAFLVRVDAGKLTWVRTWGAGRDDLARAVASRGNTTVVVGNFLDSLTLGEFTQKAAGSDDLYVAAFDGKGEPQWLWTSGGIDSDGANAVAATPDGGWIVAGSFTGEAKFGDATLISRGGTDALLIKLAGTGDVEWVKPYGGRYNDTITGLAVDPAGGIYVVGQFRDVADWGGKPLTAAGNAGNDIVLAKYDASGEHQWSQRFGNQVDDLAGGIAVDPAGNVTITGAFEGTMSFGAGDEHRSLGERDAYVARFDTKGRLQWARGFGGAREDYGVGVAADAAGNVVVTGWFQEKVDFGKGVLDSGPNKDAFVLKLDAKGGTVWARNVGDHDHDKGRAVAIDAQGGALVIGTFRFSLGLVTPALESARAEGDRVPQPDTFLIRFDR